MRLSRFYIAAPLSLGQHALPEEQAHYIGRVLRHSAGDAVQLFDGSGQEYLGQLIEVGKKSVRVELTEQLPGQPDSPLRVHLGQGLSRGERMDWAIQKATELGVAAIVPVAAERTEVRLDAERAEKRLAHWRSVVESACGQCGRARVPEVSAPARLDQALAGLQGEGLRLVLDPDGEHGLAQLQRPASARAWIAIGPEGGWSPADRSILHAAGFSGLRLGPRVLRTETAGLAAIAALQSRFGDL